MEDQRKLSIKDRLFLYVSYTGMSLKSFAYNCGLSEAALCQIKSSSNRSTFKKIYDAYPYLNPSWLLLGEGDMLRTIVSGSYIEAKENLNDVDPNNYIVIKHNNIHTIFEDLKDAKGLVQEQMRHYTTLLAQKDEQISRLLAMVEEKDRMIAKLVEKL